MPGPTTSSERLPQNPGYLSPDQMQRLFVVIRPRNILSLIALMILAITGLGWALFARVPETVQGPGIFVRPGGVRPIQSQGGGQVIEVRARPGQSVEKGDVLALLNQPEVQAELTRARGRLAELEQAERTQSQLETLRQEQEKTLQLEQDRLLGKSIAEAESLLATVEKQIQQLSTVQLEQTEASRKEVESANQALRDQVAEVRSLVNQKLVAIDRLLTLEASLLESSLTLATLSTRAVETRFKESEYRQTLAQQRQRIAELAIDRLQLTVRSTQLEQEIAQARAVRLAARQQEEERVRRLEVQLREGGVVTSPHAGRLVEVTVQAGQVVPVGGRIGAVEITEGSAETSLVHLAFFPVASGKRIEPGMLVRVTPTTIQRERFGSIVGRVKSVSAFPVSTAAAASIVGSAELIRELAPPGGMIEVEVELERADTPSGYRWTSAGPDLTLTAGTTAYTRVEVERRRPLSYLMPVLRELFTGRDATASPPERPEN